MWTGTDNFIALLTLSAHQCVTPPSGREGDNNGARTRNGHSIDERSTITAGDDGITPARSAGC